jgi:aspartate/methionine/tyrosine aminotransferase
MDSGMFKPLQIAAVQALAQGADWFGQLNAEYRSRRVLAGEIFDLIGAGYDHDSTGMFLWGKVDKDCPLLSGSGAQDVSVGQQVSDRILYEAGVFITPGFIFGKNGEDYVRISLCAKQETLRNAADKIRALLK